MALVAASFGAGAESQPLTIASPDKRIVVTFHLDATGAPRYAVEFKGQRALQDSKLGLIRDDADFSKNLRFVSASRNESVKDRYEILTAKRRLNFYRANRKEFHLQTADRKKMDIIFQVSNDGVAFRYFFPETDSTIHKLSEEVSSYHFLPGAKAWLQPMSVAKSGWKRVNPCYEELYEKEIPVGTPSPLAGWVYPALFRSGETWMLVSESSLPRNYCATRLRGESPDGEYSVGFPDPRENFHGGAVNPESTLPWLTPWRFIAIGSLKTIAESTLGIDLADKPALPVNMRGKPGKASWSWPLLGDDQTVYPVQKRFIDYASEMGWQYCLIDALWDTQIGYDKVQELIDYAKTRNVKILLWYNSAGDWNDTPQTPRNIMTNHATRIAEFERLKKMGVAGLKIDFFGGDGQSMIDYYHDIIDDATPYGFLLNFHGATPPRGWQRTYPQIVTTEAIRGMEYVTFEQTNADQEPTHAAMLPFTRNVFDPMDFTPMALWRVNDRVQRRTTSAFELALSVLFTSGIQHYAETPDGMAKAPDYVRDFLKSVPCVWDDTKFLDGYPGKFVAMARKGDGHWFLCGINGETTTRTLELNLSELRARAGTLISDGDGGNLSFQKNAIHLGRDKTLKVTLQPHGGFVAVLD